MNRKTFLEMMVMTAAATAVHAQVSPATADIWGNRVFDCHFHMRKQPEANIVYLDGAGIIEALLLTSLQHTPVDDVKMLQTKYPGRFPGFVASTDVTKSDIDKLLTDAVKAGAAAFGEIKYHVAADGPEMRRTYALAAELNVPF